MKHVQLLIGDEEYATIQEIFKNEANFKPIDRKDQVLVATLKAVISPKNLMEEDVGGKEDTHLTVKKIKEPENKEIDEHTEIKF